MSQIQMLMTAIVALDLSKTKKKKILFQICYKLFREKMIFGEHLPVDCDEDSLKLLDVGVLNTDLDEDDELDVVGVEDDDDAADDA